MTQNKMWIFASVAMVGMAGVVLAQNSGVTRTVVTKADVFNQGVKSWPGKVSWFPAASCTVPRTKAARPPNSLLSTLSKKASRSPPRRPRPVQ